MIEKDAPRPGSAPADRGRLRRVAALAWLIVLSACADTHTMMPSPTVYVGPEARPLFANLPTAKRTPPLDLLYLTNRAPSANIEADGSPYGQDRARAMTFGSAEVEFGDGLEWEALERQSVATERREPVVLRLGPVAERGRFPEIPYALLRTPDGLERKAEILDAHEAAAAALQADVARRLAASPRKEIVLFIHGYANKFNQAALTIGELCHFLGREFVCAMFSWPAGGTRGFLFGYNVDRESAEFSELHLKQAIRVLGETPGLERIHLIAHSRGTDLLATVAKDLMIESYVMGQPWQRRHKITNLVLIAPDIDTQVASQRIFAVRNDPDLPFQGAPAPRLVVRQDIIARITTYSSPNDRALSVSQWLFGSLQRLGRLARSEMTQREIEAAQPLAGLFDFIEVSGARTDLFGHSYFTSNPHVSADIIALLRYRLLPGTPGRPLQNVGGPFWKLAPPQ